MSGAVQDTAISRFTRTLGVLLASGVSILEPVLIVVMGSVIGGMVVAMYMQMFDMISVVGG